MQAELTSLPRYQNTLKKLLPIVPTSGSSRQNVVSGVLVGRQHRWVLDALTDELVKITGGQVETASKFIDADSLAMIVVYPRSDSAQVEALIGERDLTRLRLPDTINSNRPDEAIVAIQQRLTAIPMSLAAIQSEMTVLAQSWLPRLRLWHDWLQNQLAELRILNRLGETEQTFVLIGWTPEREITRIQQELATLGQDSVIVEVLPWRKQDHEMAPVLLSNPAPARPFESLTRLLNLPSYDGIDPTRLMAIFVPLFFGMILGDAGYGLILLIICFLALRRFNNPSRIRDLTLVLAYGSGWSILFGLLYGELFGTVGEDLGLHALWLHRGSSEEVQALLIFALAVGVVHIVLGLLLGFVAAYRARSRHQLLERGGTLLGLVGLFVIVAVATNQLPSGGMTPGLAILICGVAIMGSSQGWLGLLLGPLEFLGIIGNILSYLRIAAIGLASVYVAQLANDLAGSLGSLVIGIIVAVLIHALNIVLGAFSPTIHSMRLHYVEFFKLFYEGGGRPFEPFTWTSGSEITDRRTTFSPLPKGANDA